MSDPTFNTDNNLKKLYDKSSNINSYDHLLNLK